MRHTFIAVFPSPTIRTSAAVVVYRIVAIALFLHGCLAQSSMSAKWIILKQDEVSYFSKRQKKPFNNSKNNFCKIKVKCQPK